MEYQSVDQHDRASIACPLPEEPPSSPSYPSKADDLVSVLLDAQERASRKRVVWSTCLITILTLIGVMGMNAFFLSYICMVNHCYRSGLTVVSTAPLGKVLTISQITTHIVPVSVSIIMGLYSYLLAAKWLKSSHDGGPDRPSPMQ